MSSRLPVLDNSVTNRQLNGAAHAAIHKLDICRRLLSVREAAQYLGRTEKSIRHLVGRRKLRSIRADGRVMFDVSDLDAWININRY